MYNGQALRAILMRKFLLQLLVTGHTLNYDEQCRVVERILDSALWKVAYSFQKNSFTVIVLKLSDLLLNL
jgi:hypothetical protein